MVSRLILLSISSSFCSSLCWVVVVRMSLVHLDVWNTLVCRCTNVAGLLGLLRKPSAFLHHLKQLLLHFKLQFFTLISLWMPLALLVCLLRTYVHLIHLRFVQVLSKLSASCSSSTRASISSANRRFVIVLSHTLLYANLSNFKNIIKKMVKEGTLVCAKAFSRAAIHTASLDTQRCELDLHSYCTSAC